MSSLEAVNLLLLGEWTGREFMHFGITGSLKTTDLKKKTGSRTYCLHAPKFEARLFWSPPSWWYHLARHNFGSAEWRLVNRSKHMQTVWNIFPSIHWSQALLDRVDNWMGDHVGNLPCCTPWEVRGSSITPPTPTTNVVCGLSFSQSQLDFEGLLPALWFPPKSKPTQVSP